jgi:biotin transport system substrate-specific component
VEPNAATLRLAVFPRTTALTEALLVFGGACFVALCALIAIPLSFTPVPITGSTFGVLLVGASLGTLLGAASLSLYVFAGLFLPIYAEHERGWDALSGPTGGYLVGFIVAALVIGWLAERPHWDRRFASAVTAMLTGSVIIYLFGLVWLQHEINSDLNGTLEAGLYPFIVGDVLKLYLAALVLPAAWLAIKRFRGEPDEDA